MSAAAPSMVQQWETRYPEPSYQVPNYYPLPVTQDTLHSYGNHTAQRTAFCSTMADSTPHTAYFDNTSHAQPMQYEYSSNVKSLASTDSSATSYHSKGSYSPTSSHSSTSSYSSATSNFPPATVPTLYHVTDSYAAPVQYTCPPAQLPPQQQVACYNNCEYTSASHKGRPEKEQKFATPVDSLVGAIQSSKRHENGKKAAQLPTKRYCCNVPDCGMSFAQKSHLETHSLKHTGKKPWPCERGCDSSFTQRGNRTTHERGHTGERPFVCEVCDKAFAQSGNLSSHRRIHGGGRPVQCKLEGCYKWFTQRGNMKTHQNIYHKDEVNRLKAYFSTFPDPFAVASPEELELFEYFAENYQNSNKGIKGRGKGRKIKKVDKRLAVVNAAARR